jgi:predicted outer membrane repeat protein
LKAYGFLLALLTGALFWSNNLFADTFTVTNFNDNGAGSLRQAVNDNNAAGGGNTIVFDPNIFAEQFPRPQIELSSGELLVTHDVVINGISPKICPVTSNNTSRIFNIASGASANISGLLITNAKSSEIGGAIIVNGTLVMTNCELTNNSAPGLSGGAIYGSGTASSITLTGCTLSNNSADYAGGVGADGSLTMINCTVANNSANFTSGGGGIGTFTKLVLQSCTIAGNHANNGKGGGIYVAGGTVTIQNTIVSANTAGTAPDVFGTVTSKGYNIISNTAGSSGFGGGVGDQLNVTAALGPLQDNGGPTNTMAPTLGSKAIDQGKASYPGGLTLNTDQRGFARTVDQPDVPDANLGDATDVGAVEIGKLQQPPNLVVNTLSSAIGICTESDCTLPSAVALVNSDPYGVYTGPGPNITFSAGLFGYIKLTQVLELQHAATITGPMNGALPAIYLDGGGNVTIIFTYSDLTISHLEFTQGKASKNSNGGQLNAGGIHNDTGHLTLTNCLFDNNQGLLGGAIYNDRGIVSATNTNFLGNVAQYGGAINSNGAFEASRNTTVSLTNCSLLDNTASVAGGAIANTGSSNGSATIVLRNCSFYSDQAPAAQGGGVAQATDGTGVAVLDIANTIFNLETGGSIASTKATVTSRGHNLASDAVGGDAGTGPGGLLNGPGDIRNTDPKFTCGVCYNGGSSTAIPIAPDSPAVDAADPNYAPPTDERGFARVGPPDIGVFESGSTGPPPTPTPTATPTTLANISTRLRVETGDNVLIGGFIITGTQDKKVIIRAIGPSLPVPDALADPFLELHDGSGALIDSNDNWVDSPNKQAIIDSTIPPSNDLESAIVTTLPANSSAYTAIVRGVNDTTGVGLVEIYDLDQGVDSKLANISTRGLVQTGDNVMIGGFIVLGQSSQKVIVRAIGPSLPVANALADPTLELHNGNGDVIAFNDNWKDNQQAEIEATTIPPTNDLESAIVATLTPGNYTAIVRGVNDTTGVALVEVYALN